MQSKMHTYFKLFISTLYLSTFTFGGGFVIIPLMKKKFVDELKWISEEEMLNFVAIAQSSPGAVSVNASMLLGYRIAGFPGALVTVLGTVLPPLVILSVVSLFYKAFQENMIINAVLKGMRAGVAAVIADVVINLGGKIVKEKEILSVLVMAGAFIAVFFLGVNVMYIILTCGLIGGLRMWVSEKRKKAVT